MSDDVVVGDVSSASNVDSFMDSLPQQFCEGPEEPMILADNQVYNLSDFHQSEIDELINSPNSSNGFCSQIDQSVSLENSPVVPETHSSDQSSFNDSLDSQVVENPFIAKPSRAAEMRLRRRFASEIDQLKAELAEEKKLTATWKNQYFSKVKSHDKISQSYRNEIAALNRRLTYCEELVENIKKNVAELHSPADKNLVNKVLLLDNDRLRAPCKKYSIVNKYYKKKLTSDEPHQVTDKTIKRIEKNLTVVEFWLRDEISRPAPGIHEVITRNKKKMRKRYQSFTTLEIYSKFCDEIGPIVSRAQFYKLKPFWVVPLKVTERDTTACKEHENFQFLFDKLRYHKVTDAPNLLTFIKSASCDYNQRKCMYGECQNCKQFKVTFNGEDGVS